MRVVETNRHLGALKLPVNPVEVASLWHSIQCGQWRYNVKGAIAIARADNCQVVALSRAQIASVGVVMFNSPTLG